MKNHKPVPSEHAEQCAFVVWFALSFPSKVIFAIPNGGKRSIGTAKKLKAEGVVAGVPDLFIPEFKLFIEMKGKNGHITKEQTAMMKYLESVGYKCVCCKGMEEAIAAIQEYR